MIIPILKRVKDNNIGKNWCPISLLCPAAKTMGNFLLSKILTHIHSTLLNMAFGRNTRHALRCRRPPPTLLPASQENRTVLVALDLSTAFDNVDDQQLLHCIFNTNIPATNRRWLYNNMQNRRAKVNFEPREFNGRKVITGVVLGGLLSPALFNYYLADFPTPPSKIKLI